MTPNRGGRIIIFCLAIAVGLLFDAFGRHVHGFAVVAIVGLILL